MRLCQIPRCLTLLWMLGLLTAVVPTPAAFAQLSYGFSATANAQATGGTHQVTLSWSASPSDFPYAPPLVYLPDGSYSVYHYYYIYRGTSAGGEGRTSLFQVPPSSDTGTVTYTDTSVANGVTYYYQVTAATVVIASGTDSNTGQPFSYTAAQVESGRSNEASAMPLVRINSGGADYTDGAGKVWNADQDFTGGAPITTTAAITGTADPALYQAQRSGAQFSYAEPVANGIYVLSLLFAEGEGKTGGQRVFNVTANGTPLLTNYDIYADAGGANKAVVKTFPVTITNGQFSLTLTGVTGNAALAAFSLLPMRPVADIPPPGWARDVIPTDSGSEAGGAGPGSSMQVSLPSGVEENTPGPDLGAYNSVGPSVSYERMCRSTLAAQGYGSPGLSPGWVDNYDLRVVPGSRSYRLLYPNGAADTWLGTTGSLSTPPRAPYLANAPLAGTLTMTMKDRSVYTFTQIADASANYPAGAYLLSKMTNLVGHSITLNRDMAANNYRVLSITNDAASSVTLLQFTYSGANLSSVEDLASVNAGEHRQVGYAFTGGSLASVTQIAPDGGTANDLWRYGYQTLNSEPFLNSVSTPDPSDATGATYTRATVTYDPTGFVTAHTDANNRQRTFGFGPGGVQLQAFNHAGDTSPVQQWIQNFGLNNVDTGFVDAATHAASVSYAGTPSPYLPGMVTNRNNQKTSITYDPANNYGNVATVTNNRGTQMLSQYQYPADFALGQVSSMQESHVLTNGTTDSTKQATTLDYYGTTDGVINGLLHDVYSPAPDTINAANTVTTTYNYLVVNGGSLGNVASMVMPGNSAVAAMTTTFNYTTDGTYSQPEALGEPLTATDQLGEVTHFRYDGRGNRTAMIDAQGNETDFVYNLADQLVSTIYPATGNTGSGRAHADNVYQYVGGSLRSAVLYDESGAAYREEDTAYGHEGEVLSVTGSTEPVSYTYDGRYRVVAQADGNNNTTFFDFDPIGSLSAERYPNNVSGGTFDKTTFTYDADQNMMTRTDGRGVTTTLTRSDPESQVTQMAYSNLPAIVTPIAPVSFAYDNYGRRQVMSDGTGSKQYAYDDLDEMLSVTTSFINGPQNQVIGYTHFLDGSRQSMTTPQSVTNPLGSFQYQYDGVGRLSQATFPWSRGTNGGAWKYAYLNNGWLKSTASPAVLGSVFPMVRTQYLYNSRGFLSLISNYGAHQDPYEQQNSGNGDTLDNTSTFSMSGMGAYDAAGNRLKETAVISPITYNDYSTDPNGFLYPIPRTKARQANHNIAFGYDTTGLGHDELTGEQSVRTDNTINEYNDAYSNIFAYDAAYNPTMFRGASVAFNPDNQFGMGAFAYDGAGNPTTYQNATFSFDPEGRLTGISSSSFAATYDGDGLRASKTATGVTTYFLYDGSTPVMEETYSGTSATVSALSGWGADGLRSRFYPGNPTASQGTQYAFSYDAQGSVVQRHTPSTYANALGPSPAYDTQFYEAYGALRQDYGILTSNHAAPSHKDPVGFGGQWGNYTDNETGLLCLTHRYYDPNTGRFITRDPIDYAGGVNLYGYAGNNPVNEMNPSGLSPAGDAAGIVGLIPGPVGEAANLASGLDSLHEGDYVGAALSLGGEVPGLGEFATGAKILRAANRLRKAGLAAKDAEEAARGADEILRLRHYTTTSGSRGIEKDGIIIAKDQNKVFTESARRKALSPTDAERKYLLKRGHGNAHVEFNARRSEVEVRHNSLSGATEHVLNGDVRLEGRNPVFTGR